MKRGKKLVSLLLVLGLLLGATYAAQQLNPENQEEEETEQTTVFSLDPESVTALGWDYSEAVNFEKQGDTWVYAENEAFPVDETYIDTMLETLTEITSTKTIEGVENWDQYGLEVPVCTVTVHRCCTDPENWRGDLHGWRAVFLYRRWKCLSGGFSHYCGLCAL